MDVSSVIVALKLCEKRQRKYFILGGGGGQD